MKDILIVANFVSGMDGKDNNRFTYLAKELSMNHNVELVASNFYHAKKVFRTGDYSNLPYKVTLLPELGYSKNISFRRFISHKVFGKNVKKYLSKRKKPDLIYCAVPSIHAAKFCADYAKKNAVKFIIDIQDLWPEAFKMVLNIPLISDMIFEPMKKKANKIYAQADEIVAVSKTYCERARRENKKNVSIHPVYLGTNLLTFDENVMKHKNEKEKPIGELWLGYCGTLGSSYDIKCVIDALSIVEERGYKSPKFIIMGDGPKKQEFENYANCKKVNVEFMGRIPYENMCAILCQCDIVVNPIVKGSAATIINKHGDYAASGKPLINTQESKEYLELVNEYKMGINCESGNCLQLAESIIFFLNNEEVAQQMGANARKCAEERFDRKHTYKEIFELFC